MQIRSQQNSAEREKGRRGGMGREEGRKGRKREWGKTLTKSMLIDNHGKEKTTNKNKHFFFCPRLQYL